MVYETKVLIHFREIIIDILPHLYIMKLFFTVYSVDMNSTSETDSPP